MDAAESGIPPELDLSRDLRRGPGPPTGMKYSGIRTCAGILAVNVSYPGVKADGKPLTFKAYRHKARRCRAKTSTSA